jgi:hypothetical protein
VDWSEYDKAESANAPATAGAPRKAGAVSQRVYATETPGHNSRMRDLHVSVRDHSPGEIEKLKGAFPQFEDVIAYNMAYGSHKYFLLKNKEGPPSYGYFDNMRPQTEIHPLFWVATVDRMIMDGHGLPFEDGVHRDNFIGTIMAIMSDSRVQYDKVTSKAEIKATQTGRSESSALPAQTR